MRASVLLRLTLIPALVLSCQPRGGEQRQEASAMRGAAVSPPIAKPEFVLTATDGRPFDFREETDGYLTLIFFGYTHCPDICPVHMANLGAVIRELRPSQQQRIKVVFVTTDPARDTPERLRSWLDNFGRDFVGLTGDPEEIARIQRAIGVRAAFPGEARPDGGYDVAHAASVFAFTPDDAGRFMYPFGIRQADWAHDLPRLLEDDWGS